MVPGLERPPGEGNGYLLQYSCLENCMDRGTWQAAVHGVTRVRHDLATKPLPPKQGVFFFVYEIRLNRMSCLDCDIEDSEPSLTNVGESK